MTLYAMGSLVSTGVPRSHGGCGERHDRPVENGAPDKIWALTCPQCEVELRGSPHWAPTISEIPETYDEKIIREDQEKRGQRELEQGTAQALGHLSGLPAVMERMLERMDRGGVQAVTARCPQGHEALADAKFCGECGALMAAPYAPPPGATVYTPGQKSAEPWDAVPDTGPEHIPTAEELEALGLPELREIAAKHGIKSARSKADQMRLITEHFAAGGQ